jgi:NDP-sugar pyrophosphorylase family protein
MKAIILAGGRGTRLAPYTTILPKPLMPIGNIPILEIVIRQLARLGFNDITLAVGHLAELLMAYCGDGIKYGLKLSYSREEIPLGTAGPISLVPNLDDTFLVMNGDLLTTLNYSDMWRYHKERGAVATLATYQRDVKVDLGVIEFDADHWVTNYVEKPTFHYSVSTGIYIFEPAVLSYIQPGQHLDLPELVLRLLKQGERVSCYNYQGYWLDIGRPDDYQEALLTFEAHRQEFLPEE